MIVGVARRIASARTRTGIPRDDVASAVGINASWVAELEIHDEDLPCTLSLEQVCRLARVLEVSPRDLVCGNHELAPSQTSAPETIARAIQEAAAAKGQTSAQLEEAVGWALEPVVSDPRRIWSDWCVDQSEDACSALGIDWRAVLPASDAEAAV